MFFLQMSQHISFLRFLTKEEKLTQTETLQKAKDYVKIMWWQSI